MQGVPYVCIQMVFDVVFFQFQIPQWMLFELRATNCFKYNSEEKNAFLFKNIYLSYVWKLVGHPVYIYI